MLSIQSQEGAATTLTEPENLERRNTDPLVEDAKPTESGEISARTTGVSHTDEAGYRLAESESMPAAAPSDSPPALPLPQPVRAADTTFQPASDDIEQSSGDESFPIEPPDVDEVWSRWTEWKEPILWSAGGIVFSILIVVGGYWVATLIFLLASLYGAYYIVISLEVPVRVTPEQAVKEFYGAAAHRLPNFRRMYTLLTADGRQSDEFSNFAGFRSYWQTEIAGLSRTATWLVPLDFRIEGFRCRYNGEKTLARVHYVLKVVPRGRPESDESTGEFTAQNLAVKGPDGQWYLNDGTLPEPS
jgi:hypothetical protein